MIAFAASIVGFIRKAGWPKWTAIWLRNACFTEEFTNLTYFLSICLTPPSFFTYTPIIINMVLFVAVQFKNILVESPTAAILSLPFISSQINKVADHEMQKKIRILRGQVEVYVGFYIIFGIFFGVSGLLGMMFYW
jgi:hypothetical protein